MLLQYFVWWYARTPFCCAALQKLNCQIFVNCILGQSLCNWLSRLFPIQEYLNYICILILILWFYEILIHLYKFLCWVLLPSPLWDSWLILKSAFCTCRNFTGNKFYMHLYTFVALVRFFERLFAFRGHLAYIHICSFSYLWWNDAFYFYHKARLLHESIQRTVNIQLLIVHQLKWHPFFRSWNSCSYLLYCAAARMYVVKFCFSRKIPANT